MLKSFRSWWFEFRQAVSDAIFALRDLRDLYRHRARREEESLEPDAVKAQKDRETAEHYDAVAKRLQEMRHQAEYDPPGGPELEDKDR